MLMVPPAVYFMGGGYKWLKAILLGSLLCCGIYISIAASYFSFGPYKQSLDYLQKARPDVKKIVHVSEITAGPFYEYGKDGPWCTILPEKRKCRLVHQHGRVRRVPSHQKLRMRHWKKMKYSVWLNFHTCRLNEKNCDLILSQCQTLGVDRSPTTNHIAECDFCFIYLNMEESGEHPVKCVCR